MSGRKWWKLNAYNEYNLKSNFSEFDLLTMELSTQPLDNQSVHRF